MCVIKYYSLYLSHSPTEATQIPAKLAWQHEREESRTRIPTTIGITGSRPTAAGQDPVYDTQALPQIPVIPDQIEPWLPRMQTIQLVSQRTARHNSQHEIPAQASGANFRYKLSAVISRHKLPAVTPQRKLAGSGQVRL